MTEKGLTPTTFSKKINKERQTVYDIFDRKSIDTDLLLIISRVLSYNFFQHYTEYFEQTGDKLLEEKPKLVTVEELEGWKIKFYEISEDLRIVNKKYIDLLEQQKSAITDFSKISFNEQTIP